MGNNNNLCVFILIATVVGQATWVVRATDYRVGDEKGWTDNVDYQAWLNGKEFIQQDVLVFKYNQAKHNVLIVSEDDYNTCCTAHPLQTPRAGGCNPITLSITGRFGFISGRGDDCKNGMKLLIDIKPCPQLQEGTKVILN